MEAEGKRLSAAPVVGRLAPSPTGALHLGNARSFLLAWLSVRQQGGTMLLRIEDIDSPRVKPGALEATIVDLKWLGLDWDVGPDKPNPDFEIPLVQSQRLARYRQVLNTLIADGQVYPCSCTRSEVARAASAPHEQQLEGPVYPGTCRGRSLDELSSAELNFAWRWRFSDRPLAWCDALVGELTANPAIQLGDFVIARSDATPAYQLAVVVDDHDMGVTEVARGDDLVFSTFRQLAILHHFGWEPPRYIHLPLLVGNDGRRLAKRHGDTRISYLREQGIAPEAVVGWLAWSCGMLAESRAVSAVDLIGRLQWDRLHRQESVVDQSQVVQSLLTLPRE